MQNQLTTNYFDYEGKYLSCLSINMPGNFPCVGIYSWIYDHYVWQHEQEEKLVAHCLS